MNEHEKRTAWLVTHDGAPKTLRWGLVRTWELAQGLVAAGALDARKLSWASALAPDELPVDGWDAVPIAWRRAPRLAQKFFFDEPSIGTRVEGRTLFHAGCIWDLDDPGRPHPSGGQREPLRPDVVIENDAALLHAVETVGWRMLSLVEKGTQRRILVDPGGVAKISTEEVVIRRDGIGQPERIGGPPAVVGPPG